MTVQHLLLRPLALLAATLAVAAAPTVAADAVESSVTVAETESRLESAAAGIGASPRELVSVVGCRTDRQCLKDRQFCGHGACQDHGRCFVDLDCVNPSNKYDAAPTCAGFRTCVDGFCVSDCTRQCPAGTSPVDCFVSPCDMTPCAGAVACVDFKCGGCHAVHFDAAGYGGCDNFEETPPPNAPPFDTVLPTRTPTDTPTGMPTDTPTGMPTATPTTMPIDTPTGIPTDTLISAPVQQTAPLCASNSECTAFAISSGVSAYCASGVCLERSKCRSNQDCLNPSNVYDLPACQGEGAIECIAGTCQRKCTKSNCVDGSAQVVCRQVPCDALPCATSVQCANDYCGGCHAIHFDASGDRVCQTTSTLPEASIVKRFQNAQQELNRAKNEWMSFGIQTYDYGFQKQCRCFLDFVAQQAVSVVDGDIQTARFRQSGNTVPSDIAADTQTVEQLFDTIQSAIDRQIANVQVKFNREYGYPERIYLDRSFAVADDETTLMIDYLVPFTAVQQSVQASQTRWDETEADAYTYTFRRTCACPDSGIPYVIDVANGVVSAVNGQPQQFISSSSFSSSLNKFSTPSNEVMTNFPTIADLFALVDDAVNSKAFDIDVQYDTTYGYPTRLYIDPNERINGDEINFLSSLDTTSVRAIDDGGDSSSSSSDNGGDVTAGGRSTPTIAPELSSATQRLPKRVRVAMWFLIGLAVSMSLSE